MRDSGAGSSGRLGEAAAGLAQLLVAGQGVPFVVEPFRGLAHLREGRVVLPELVPALHLSGEGCDELPGDPIPQRSVSPAGRGDALAEPFVDGGLLGLRGVLRDELLRLGLLLEADLGPGASVGDGDRVWARLLVLEGPFLERFARAVHLRGAAVVGGDSVHDHMDVEVIAIVVADDVGLPVLEPEGFEGAVYSPLDLVLGRAVVVLPREGVVKHRVRQLPARRLDASQLLEGHGARDGGGHHPGRVVGGTGCEVRPGVEVDGHPEGHALLGLRVTGVVGDVLQHPQGSPGRCRRRGGSWPQQQSANIGQCSGDVLEDGPEFGGVEVALVHPLDRLVEVRPDPVELAE